MEVLQEVIYTQNLDLLHRIADDMYIDECDKQTFINKYHKKNFFVIQRMILKLYVS